MQKNVYVPLVILLAVAIAGFVWWQQSQSPMAADLDSEQMESQMMAASPTTLDNDEMMMDDMAADDMDTSMGSPAADGGSEMMMAEDGEADMVIEMSNFAYAPNMITAQAGQTIKVKVTTIDGFHDFVIDELDVASTQLSDGDSQIVEIKIPEDASGKEYEFYCSVGQHRQMGMVGTLMVE